MLVYVKNCIFDDMAQNFSSGGRPRCGDPGLIIALKVKVLAPPLPMMPAECFLFQTRLIYSSRRDDLTGLICLSIKERHSIADI